MWEVVFKVDHFELKDDDGSLIRLAINQYDVVYQFIGNFIQHIKKESSLSLYYTNKHMKIKIELDVTSVMIAIYHFRRYHKKNIF